MKKFLTLVIAILVLAAGALAGYSDYYTGRADAKKAEAAGDVGKAVEMYLAAEAEASVLAALPDMKLPWGTYAEWQRNNAAHALIESFKETTNWTETMEGLKAIPNGPERLKAAEALKEKARVSLFLLDNALEVLNGRKFIKAEVMAKVKSNREFCTWVKDWVK